MQIKLFTIPIQQVVDYNEELNKFLRSNNIIEIEKQLVQTATGAFWCFYISYLSHAGKSYNLKEKIDYHSVLNEEEFEKFSKLREIRKKIAVEDAVSSFVVFTDAELAEIAKLKELTPNNLRTVKGIGDKKAEKYGERLINFLNNSKA